MKSNLKQIVCIILFVVMGHCAASAAEGARPPLARPTPAQIAWQDIEIGMFIHWVPEMWQHDTSADTATLLRQIDPSKVNTDQWVEVAAAMGARYIVFVARHVDGFRWCQPRRPITASPTSHGAAAKGTSCATCRSPAGRGIKLGVYLQPADRHKIG